MSDKKISQLPASTTPLAGTEELPLVQSGTTKKVAVGSMFGANVYTFLNTPNSANLAAAVTDETGTGALVFGTNPTFINSGSANPSATFANTAFQDVLVNYFMANNGNKITLQFASDNGVTLTNSITSYGSAAGGVPSLNNVIEMGNASGKVRVTTTGDVLATTGNLVIGTSGKGIDFSADGQAAGMTSELLDDYEEGTWTPSISDGTTSIAGSTGAYTKIGNKVTCSFDVYNKNISGFLASGLRVSGLPFTNTGVSAYNVILGSTGSNISVGAFITGANNYAVLYFGSSGPNVSPLTKASFLDDTQASLWGMFTYYV